MPDLNVEVDAFLIDIDSASKLVRAFTKSSETWTRHAFGHTILCPAIGWALLTLLS